MDFKRRRGNAEAGEKESGGRAQRMVGGKRGKLGVKVNVRGVDPDSGAGAVRHVHIRMDLHDGDRQRGTSIDDGVFAEEDDLAGSGGSGHGSAANLSLRYER